MAKSPDAFRTISEVADWLGIQAHVLRFWESKFTQVKPVKRAGGRRYYRPNDMLLLGGIKQLLHEDGLTIKGVQKILREQGMSYVIAKSQPLDDLSQAALEESKPAPQPEPEPRGVVLSFDAASKETEAADAPEAETPEMSETAAHQDEMDSTADAAAPATEEADTEPDHQDASVADETPEPQPEPEPEITAAPEPHQEQDPSPEPEDVPQHEPETAADEDGDDGMSASLPAFLRRPAAPPAIEEPAEEAAEPREEAGAGPEHSDEAASATPEPQPEPEPEPAPRARMIDMPPLTDPADMDVSPGPLSAAHRARRLTPSQAAELTPLLKRLITLRETMQSGRSPSRPAPPAD